MRLVSRTSLPTFSGLRSFVLKNHSQIPPWHESEQEQPGLLRLPTELLTQVFEYLEEDVCFNNEVFRLKSRRDMLALSLTCRALSPVARICMLEDNLFMVCEDVNHQKIGHSYGFDLFLEAGARDRSIFDHVRQLRLWCSCSSHIRRIDELLSGLDQFSKLRFLHIALKDMEPHKVWSRNERDRLLPLTKRMFADPARLPRLERLKLGCNEGRTNMMSFLESVLLENCFQLPSLKYLVLGRSTAVYDLTFPALTTTSGLLQLEIWCGFLSIDAIYSMLRRTPLLTHLVTPIPVFTHTASISQVSEPSTEAHDLCEHLQCLQIHTFNIFASIALTSHGFHFAPSSANVKMLGPNLELIKLPSYILLPPDFRSVTPFMRFNVFNYTLKQDPLIIFTRTLRELHIQFPEEQGVFLAHRPEHGQIIEVARAQFQRVWEECVPTDATDIRLRWIQELVANIPSVLPKLQKVVISELHGYDAMLHATSVHSMRYKSVEWKVEGLFHRSSVDVSINLRVPEDWQTNLPISRVCDSGWPPVGTNLYQGEKSQR